MADRFDLEQQIMQCWHITDDIATLEEQGASMTDMVSLAAVYEFKFQKLWSIFEQLVHQKEFAGSQVKVDRVNLSSDYID